MLRSLVARIRPLRSFLVALTLVALAMLVATLSLAHPALPWPRAVRATAPPLPDTLLLTTSRLGGNVLPEPGGTDIAVLPSGSTTPQPLLPGAMPPVIAPDGRQLFYVQYRQDGTTFTGSLVAVDADTLQVQWAAPVLDLPLATAARLGYGIWLQPVATRDRLYLPLHTFGSAEPLTILGLDRATGQQRSRWSIALDGHPASSIQLYVPPDDQTLDVLAQLDSKQSDEGTLLDLGLRLPDGTEVFRHRLPLQDGATMFGRVPFAPDGRTLYQLGYRDDWKGLTLRFLDLPAGAFRPRLDLPLEGPSDLLPYEQASSPDGRTLYVLAPTLDKLAIVDLVGRRLERVVTIEGGQATANAPGAARGLAALRRLFVTPAWAKLYFQGGMQLSPDGRRLYAVGARHDDRGDHADGILVIATDTWRVVAHWLPGTAPSGLLLGDGGELLYALPSNVADVPPRLLALDPSTGTQ